MSNARELAQIPSTPSGRRNLIINGAMNVAQRGTSTTGVNSNTYASLDRFKILTNEGTFTVSQSSEAPAGFANSYKIDCTTADTSLAAAGKVNIDTYLEGQNLQQIQKGLSTAKQVTLSFWVKSSVTGTYIVELFDIDNSRHINKSYSISSADTWEKKEILIDADTTGAFGDDNGASLQIRWWLAAGSNWTSGTLATTWQAQDNTDRAVGLSVNIADSTSNDWYITGVQLEVGSVATEFEHRSYGEELTLCQRYFETSYDDGVGLSSDGKCTGTSLDNSGLDTIQGQRFMVAKRISPTVNILAIQEIDGTGSFSVIAVDHINSLGFLRIRSSGTTTGVTYRYHYNADAEL